MADLPSLTDHMNDIEIAANAPITETLNRRYGSNINYLLDFLGINDGDPLPGGGASLSNFFTAITVVGGHTMDLQASIPATNGNTSGSIGTFTMEPFLNQVIYMTMTRAGSFALHENGFSVAPILSAPAVPNTEFTVNIDATGSRELKIAQKVIGLTTSGIASGQVAGVSHVTNLPPGVKRTGTRALNPGFFEGNFSASSEQWFVEVAELDWRDGSSIQLGYSAGNQNYAVNYYRGYRLNVESLIF